MGKKPNIIVFMTDQQNADTILGNQRAFTPNLDAFRQNAVTFLSAYCASPHCCPSRASFFSGLYPSQHGVWNNVEVDNALSRGLYDGVTLFPEILQANGYHTVFSGKWHVSAYEGPEDRGFDDNVHERITNYGRFLPTNKPRHKDWEKLYCGPESYTTPPTCRIPGQIFREGYPLYQQFGTDSDLYHDQVTVSCACESIRTHDYAKPLFLFVGTKGPHDPYKPPQQYLDMYKNMDIQLPASFHDSLEDRPGLYRRTKDRYALTPEEHVECIRHYLAFTTYQDALFGQLVDALKACGEYDNTYILYLSDHGDYAGAHGLWAKGLPCFREAYHIPAVIGGGKIRGSSSVDELVSITDFAPTILELAGLSGTAGMTGKSLLPFVNRLPVETWRTEHFTQTNGNELYGIQRAVWNKKWKYVFNGFDYDELYDLEQDPLEMHNLIGDTSLQPIVRSMCKKLWEFAYQTGDNCTCDYIMVSLAPYGPGIIWKST